MRLTARLQRLQNTPLSEDKLPEGERTAKVQEIMRKVKNANTKQKNEWMLRMT